MILVSGKEFFVGQLSTMTGNGGTAGICGNSNQGMAGGLREDLQEPRKGNTRTKYSPGFSIIFFKLFFTILMVYVLYYNKL